MIIQDNTINVKTTVMKIIKITVFLLIIAIKVSAGKLVVYNAPVEAVPAPEFELEVDGQKVFVYQTKSAAIAYFSFSESAQIKVTFLSVVYQVDVRPQKMNIKPDVYRNQIQFTLNSPANLSVEINKNIKRPLFIFANLLEKNVPDKNQKNILYYEGGKIHKPGKVFVNSNQTVYIEGGAIVRGSFIAANGKHINIEGRGIIDNSMYEKYEARPIEIRQCSDVKIEGIIITEAKNWSCSSFSSNNVLYKNMKVVSDYDTDDGIDIVGCKNVIVDSCFIRTKDDCVAIKSGVNYFTDFNSQINVSNIIVQNSVFWNGVWGNGLEIGFETRADTISDITFRNCDLIHVEGYEGTFTIHNGDRAVVKNIHYEDIRVEDAQGWLIDFRVLFSQYSKDTIRGKIEDVYFKNIYVEGDHYPSSQILGLNSISNIQNITLENFNIHGTKVNSIYNGMIATINTDSLLFK
jgi:hypothetical protein